MNKITAVVLRHIFAVMGAIILLTGTAAAEATKLPLNDTLTLDEFVAAYNKISQYAIANYQNHKPAGERESYLGIIDDANIMMTEVDKSGKLQKIIIMHRGNVDENVKSMLGEIFSCVNVALGYEIKNEDSMVILTSAYNLLEITAQDMGASSLSRDDIGREYVFVKAYSKQNGIYSIMIEAWEKE